MRSLSGASPAIVAMLALGSLTASFGCAKIGEIQARKAFKSANQAYQQQDFKKASEFYEEAIKAAPDTQVAHESYFFLGNSYDNLFKPSKRGEKDNDDLLQKAVQNYQLAAEKLSSSNDAQDKLLGRRSLEYLVASYGAEKLNDPAKAEPVVQRMIQLEPGEPANYFVLAQIYGYYNRQGHFDKTIEALEERASREPNNPEAFYTIATYYWDEAYRDFKLKENEKKAYVQKGIEAVDHALQIKPDYMEALVYKNLLLRLQANLEKDTSKQQMLIKEADKLRDRAQELRKQKAAGTTP